jgi:Flp pilus assembly protein TadG
VFNGIEAMKTNSPRIKFPGHRGQATVELALCVSLLAMLAMAVIDLGVYISSATRLPEAARAGALLLTPSNNTNGVNVHPTQAMQEIIRAAANQSSMDLHTNAQITVSYIQRVGSVSRITKQYVKSANSPANVQGTAQWPSRLGNLNDDVSVKIPPATFANDSDWVVAVEVFYEPQFLTPMAKLLNWSSTKSMIYEIAIY